jgi:alpha-beta hydrolase superfamily lysophospholipase
VAIYDLPGHGLSNGASCSIDDFSEYVSVFDDFLKMCRSQLPGPYYFVGHSTGAAIAIDYLHRVNSKAFDKVIYIAPLVRSACWKISKAHHYLAKPFIKAVPRVFFDNSSDPQFNRFLKDDPLQCKEIPLKWVEALFDWNGRVEGFRLISRPVLILQGTDDTVVDWKYNIPFLKQKNASVTVKWFQDARHHLVNESAAIRSEVLDSVKNYFQR